jgi:ABC-type bacteriocin/lantibiotic exporter with double-glycine peptidase domain
MAEDDNRRPADPGLAALIMMLQFHGIAADGAQIRHRIGGLPVERLPLAFAGAGALTPAFAGRRPGA